MPGVEPDSVKVIFHHFTGEFDSMNEPVFKHYPGYVSGPFKQVEPPVYERVPGLQEPRVKSRGKVEYFPNKYQVTFPKGNGWMNLDREGWHLEVNVGTEFFPRWARFENCNESAHGQQRMSFRSSWFEFVKEPEVTSDPAAGKTQAPRKGK